ncbi:MAG: hypothetical protein Q4G24_13915 [Paracoccus sp. (in: a-proteobacteria)]|uniref:hypothetical protein n=1 Tax=Paracoccus sp. TaxID=267 RepID=UPI0026DF07D2|nr:hypothetical protein [Paracoccus sp. (in: a-proteobacteria)]MDO5622554.1 hypothetical protein [Paracoccus sp. (in: a-proteobacteria)]
MQIFPRAMILALILTGPALADGGVRVQLPDVSGLSRPEAQSLIAELAQVNVITSNCPGYEITDGEWTLITGTGDKLAAQLGLDPTSYDQKYYGPAFRLLDDPTACDRIGPQAGPLLKRLIDMGGGTKPLGP